MGLWNFCAMRQALIHNLSPKDLFQAEKQLTHQFQFGVRRDLSNLCTFDWYDWCFYPEEGKNSFLKQKENMG
eukprot:14453708-Ditylum_brightwellii.AAC.1